MCPGERELKTNLENRQQRERPNEARKKKRKVVSLGRFRDDLVNRSPITIVPLMKVGEQDDHLGMWACQGLGGGLKSGVPRKGLIGPRTDQPENCEQAN